MRPLTMLSGAVLLGVAVFSLVKLFSGNRRQEDKGSVSGSWLAEHRADVPDGWSS